MPRLKDYHRCVGKIGRFQLVKRVYAQIVEDNIFTWASAIAYSWLFAIFPFFVFLLTLVPLIPDRYKANLEWQAQHSLQKILDPSAFDTVWSAIHPQLHTVLHDPPKGFFSIGILLTLWGGSGGMAMTMTALDKCYDIEKGRPFYKARPIAVLLTASVAILVISVFVLLPVGTFARHQLVARSHEIIEKWPWTKILFTGWVTVLAEILRYSVSIACLVLALSLVYHFGTSVKQPYRLITPGAVFTILCWLVLGGAFRLYVTKFGNYQKTYGAVAGVVILLLFFYIDSLALLIGAEINSEVDYVALNLKSGATDFTGKAWAEKPPATSPGAERFAAIQTDAETSPPPS